MFNTLLAALLLAPGCGEPGHRDRKSGTDSDSGVADTSGPTDQDGDGWSPPVDCDDDNPDVNPEADEYCNGIDDDCDGEVDEPDAIGAGYWFEDADSDGYGNPDVHTESCDRPDGVSWNNDDCDDTDASVYPGASELCDGLDNDCDEGIDEDDRTWYADADGDGYGSAATPVEADGVCAPPEGSVLDDTDCDDADSAVYPGAADTWYDGTDSDCDGASDYDADGDGHDSDAWGGDDCDDADEDTSPSAFEMCDSGKDEDCDTVVDEQPCAISLADADARLRGEKAGDYAGDAVAGAGDTNGDGFDDVLVGAKYARSNHGGEGATYLVLGPVSGTMSLALADARMDGLGYSGFAVAGAGDTDGDGFDDFLVGSPVTDYYDWGDGVVSLVMGPVSGALDLGYAWGTNLVGDQYMAALGEGIADAGDVDGDGHDDLLIGGPGTSDGGKYAGAAWLVIAPPSGTHVVSDVATASFIGESPWDYAGMSVAGAGDTDGDGYTDLLISAPNDDDAGTDAGAVYLVLGPSSGSMRLAHADAKLTGEAVGAEVGGAIVGGTDVDGDGLDDVLVGSPEGTSEGSVRVFLGPVVGNLGLADADQTVAGEAVGDWAGVAVASLGDLDGDALPEIAVGASPPYTVAGHGCYYMPSPFTGLASLGEVMLRLEPEASEGAMPASPGDVDGDGTPDLLVATPWGDEADSWFQGVVYLVNGTTLRNQ